MSLRDAFTFLGLALLIVASPLQAQENSRALGLPGLLEEVATESSGPHAFDWKQSSWELQLGYGTVDENNSFENTAWELGFGFPSDSGWIFATGFRRVIMAKTKSSEMLGRSPFEQAAQMTRYEMFFNADWRLLEGRAMSLLSPWHTDLEQATFLVLGLHLNHPNKSNTPKKKDKPDPFPGQRRVNSERNFEIGLKWQLYFPQSFGFFFMAQRQIPWGRTGDLKAYNYFTGGVLWSFGAS